MVIFLVAFFYTKVGFRLKFPQPLFEKCTCCLPNKNDCTDTQRINVANDAFIKPASHDLHHTCMILLDQYFIQFLVF